MAVFINSLIHVVLGGVSFVFVVLSWWQLPIWTGTLFTTMFLVCGCLGAFFTSLVGSHVAKTFHWSLPFCYTGLYWLMAVGVSLEALATGEFDALISLVAALMVTLSSFGGGAVSRRLQQASGRAVSLTIWVVSICTAVTLAGVLHISGQKIVAATWYNCGIHLLEPRHAQDALIQELEKHRIPYKEDEGGGIRYREKDQDVVQEVASQLGYGCQVTEEKAPSQ